MLDFIKNICINYQSIFSFGYLSTLWLLQKREGRQPELWSPRHLDEYDTYYIWFIAYLGILYIHLLIYFQNSNNLLAYHFRTLSFSVSIQHKYQQTVVVLGQKWSWAKLEGRSKPYANYELSPSPRVCGSTRQLNICI